jgi:hypothetical protein
MGRYRFVQPDVVRLPISDGDFIDIKKQLNHGERDDMFAAMSATSPVGDRLRFDARRVRTLKVLTYLVGWSLTKPDPETQDDKPVVWSLDVPEQTRIDTLRNLDTYSFDEIYAAIDAHEEAMDRERTEKKRTADTPPASKATSALPSAAAGATSGSVN